jgi:GNAT superfamily N-acetyltransferase
MLAIRPDLVGDFSTVSSPAAVDGAVQDDLAHLGFGVLRPAGPWGDPRRADAKIGGIIAASISANLAEAARRAWAGWTNTPPTGRGPRRRPEAESPDIPAGLELCRIAGWNHREADWRLFLELAPEGCFGAVVNGRVAGTVAAVPASGGPAWIALMLVRPGVRGHGVGKLLFRRALEALAGEACVKLLATPDGYGLYRSHGFLTEDVYTLMVRPAGPPGGADEDAVVPMTEKDLPEAAALDGETGLPSGMRLLRVLLTAFPSHAGVVRDASGRLAGFHLGRPGKTTKPWAPGREGPGRRGNAGPRFSPGPGGTARGNPGAAPAGMERQAEEPRFRGTEGSVPDVPGGKSLSRRKEQIRDSGPRPGLLTAGGRAVTTRPCAPPGGTCTGRRRSGKR